MENCNEFDEFGCSLEDEEEDEQSTEDWRLPAATVLGPSAVPPPNPLLGKGTLQGKTAESGASETRLPSMELNTNKAGMEGLDKARINKIITEASKGSRFYENQKKRDEQMNKRIEQMLERLGRLTDSQKQAALIQVDEMVRELESGRDLSRTIVHLDMDMFYAAVEMRDDPTLRDKPMAVGGSAMLSTSNYHARRFGVRAAMPGFIGKKLCPQLIIVKTHFDKYRAVSHQVREILAEYDPNYCPMSLDEAYFDLTSYLVRRQEMSDDERTFPYRSEEESSGELAKIPDQDRACDGAVNLDEVKMTSTATVKETGVLPPNKDAQPKDTISGRSESCMGAHSHPTDTSLGPAQERGSHPTDTSPGPNKERGSHPTDNSPGPDQERGQACKEESRSMRTFGVTCEEVVEEIRFRIEQKTQLTASAGIAPNCMLAKICSDKNKPNGQYRIQPTRPAVMQFIKDLPIRKISGIGKVTERMLSALGIQTCTHLYQQRAILQLLFSQISSSHFLRISLGLGSTHVERDGERKSMSTERTFREISAPNDLYDKCLELCQSLAQDLQEQQIVGKTVTIKLKTVHFEVKTKASSVKTPIRSAEEIFSVARDLLRTEIRSCHPQPLRLRLMGVRLSTLQDGSKVAKSKQGTLLQLFNKKQNSKQTPAVPEDNQSQCSNHSNGRATSTGTADSNDLDSVQERLAMPSWRTDMNPGLLELGGTSQSNDQSGQVVGRIFQEGVGESPERNVTSCNASCASAPMEEQRVARTDNQLLPSRKSMSGVSELQIQSSGESELSRTTENALMETRVTDETLLVSEDHRASDSRDLRSRGCSSDVMATSLEVGSKADSASELVFTCPICGQERVYSSLEDFNQHIDVCLNKTAIKEILQSDVPSSSSRSQLGIPGDSPKKKVAQKRPHAGQVSSNKKRKSDRGGSSHSRTLHHFFHNQQKQQE